MLLYILSAAFLSIAFGGSVGTCPLQKDCIRFEFVEDRPLNGPCVGECQWQVCLFVDYNNGCAKQQPDTISHTCIKSDGICGGGPFDGATKLEGTTDGDFQCQVGKTGDTLQFLLKDGDGCANSYASITADDFGRGVVPESKATCRPTTSKGEGCSGNPAGMECIWEVIVPPCKVYSENFNVDDVGVEGEDEIEVTGNPSQTNASAQNNGSITYRNCTKDADCKNGGVCTKNECHCAAGFAGYKCDKLQCKNILPRYPNMKILDSGVGPTCTLGEAASDLGPYDCHRITDGCNVLKCDKPIPPDVINAIKHRCPDRGPHH